MDELIRQIIVESRGEAYSIHFVESGNVSILRNHKVLFQGSAESAESFLRAYHAGYRQAKADNVKWWNQI